MASKMNMITILVTACGAQFMPGLSDCLKNNGEREIRIIGTDIKYDKTILQMVDSFYVVPPANDSSYVDNILDVCKKEKVDIVLPFMSSELLPLLNRKKDFEDNNIILSISNKECVEITNNKYKFYSFLKKNSIYVPRFALVKKVSDLESAFRKCGFPANPVCIKATESSGSRGIRIVDPSKSSFDILFKEKPNSFYTSFDELYNTLKVHADMPEMMAMEYLPGMEGSVDLIADNGKILYMCYRRTIINLHSIPQESVLENNQKAYKIATEVIKALNYTGSADLDFKDDKNGNPVLMELNPRIAATMRIFKEGNLNLPYLRVKQLLNEKLPSLEIRYGVRMKRRYLEMFSYED